MRRVLGPPFEQFPNQYSADQLHVRGIDLECGGQKFRRALRFPGSVQTACDIDEHQ
jgi:hypothetical protein